jgi:protein-tyrosine kinase
MATAKNLIEPIVHADRTSPLIPGLQAELFRNIYASIRLTPDHHPVIGVTSAIRGEGRTTVACGLAQTLALDLDCPITLIEADLEQPFLASALGIPPAPGLADLIRDGGQLADVRQRVSSNLYVVPAGSLEGDAARLLHQLSNVNLSAGRSWQSSITVLDLPPLLEQGYAGLAARTADTLLLVVRTGVTPASTVREALARLDNQTPYGVVLNGSQSSLPGWWPERGA